MNDDEMRKAVLKKMALGGSGSPDDTPMALPMDQQQAIGKKMEEYKIPNMDDTDLGKAMKLASRGGDYTPEEEKFMDDMGQNKYMRGLMQGGGFMGGVQSIKSAALPVAETAVAEAKGAFPTIKKMFEVGGKQFPAENTAQALKVKEALEKAGQILPNRALRILD